jgi:hypothetical protein
MRTKQLELLWGDFTVTKDGTAFLSLVDGVGGEIILHLKSGK